MATSKDPVRQITDSLRSNVRLARRQWRQRQLEQGEAGWGRPDLPPPVLPPDRPTARVAVIGAGAQGRVMAKGVRALTGAEVVGLADRDPDALATSRAAAGLTEEQCFTDVGEMLAVARPDLAIVATTAPSHAALATIAVDAGVPQVLVEKPIDVSYERAADLVDRARAAGTRLSVHYIRRWSVDHRAMVRAMRAGDIGEPRVLFASIGSATLGMNASHHVDFARMVFDSEPVEVQATLVSPAAENKRGAEFTDPAGRMLIRFASGARAYLDFEEDLSPWYQAITIRGDDGSVLIEEPSRAWTLRGRSGRAFAFPMAEAKGSPRVAARTLVGLLTEPEPACTGDDGLRALEAVIAAQHSSDRGGTPVALPLSPADRSHVMGFA